MTWYAKTDRASRSTRIRRGAVPLGQHDHTPEKVLGTTPARVRVVPGVIHQPPPPRPPDPPTGVYPGLPRPAPREAGCSCCTRTAALVDPATGKGYCAGCWITCQVQMQMD